MNIKEIIANIEGLIRKARTDADDAAPYSPERDKADGEAIGLAKVIDLINGR